VDLVRHPCAELAYNAHQLALNVPVALSEAISNAILRANHEDPGKRVRIRAAVDILRLVVRVGVLARASWSSRLQEVGSQHSPGVACGPGREL